MPQEKNFLKNGGTDRGAGNLIAGAWERWYNQVNFS